MEDLPKRKWFSIDAWCDAMCVKGKKLAKKGSQINDRKDFTVSVPESGKLLMRMDCSFKFPEV